MELVVRKTDLLRELQLFQGIVERKNTIPILANVLIEAAGDEVKLLATDLEVGSAQPVRRVGRQRRVADAAGEEALRDHQGAAGDRRPDRGRQERRQSRGGSFRLAHADAAARGFPDAAGCDRRLQRDAAARRAAADGREDAVCDHRRGHPIFPERRAVHPAAGFDEPGFDRRPSARADHRAAREASKGKGKAGRRGSAASSCRARRCSSSAGCWPKVKGTSTTSAARTTCSSTSAGGC